MIVGSCHENQSVIWHGIISSRKKLTYPLKIDQFPKGRFLLEKLKKNSFFVAKKNVCHVIHQVSTTARVKLDSTLKGGDGRWRGYEWLICLDSKLYTGGGNSNIFNVQTYLGRWSIWTNMFQLGWIHVFIGKYSITPTKTKKFAQKWWLGSVKIPSEMVPFNGRC